MTLKKIVRAFVPPIAVFLVHLILFSNNLYPKLWWLDIVMHVAGGAAIALTASSLHMLAREKKYISHMNQSITFLFILSFVALVAVFWEFSEFIVQYFVKFELQPGLEDTLFDLFMGLCGSVVSYLLSYKSKQYNYRR
jgi:hypothetical protein